MALCNAIKYGYVVSIFNIDAIHSICVSLFFDINAEKKKLHLSISVSSSLLAAAIGKDGINNFQFEKVHWKIGHKCIAKFYNEF